MSDLDGSGDDRSDSSRLPRISSPRKATSKIQGDRETVNDNGSREDIDLSTEIDRLIVLQERAEQTLDRQIQWLRAIDQKAIRLLRFNVITIGLFLTLFSIVYKINGSGVGNTVGSSGGTGGSSNTTSIIAPLFGDLTAFINTHTKVGSIVLLLSTVVAGLTYTASSLQLGIGAPALVRFRNGGYENPTDYDDPDYFRKLVCGYYPAWIFHNHEKIKKNARLITLTVWLVIYGITMLALGIAYPLFDFIPKDGSFLIASLVIGISGLLSFSNRI